MRTLIAAALAGILLFGQAYATQPTPEARMVAAAAALEKHAGDFGTLDGKPGDIAAWNALWSAVQAYVADRLDQHATPKVIEKQAPPLSSYYGGLHIVTIGKDLYAVSVSAGPMGNAFVTGKRNGHFATVWDIRQSAMGNTAWGWNAEAARNQCTRCRPASGTVFALPPDSTGRARFYIDAGYFQEMGATSGAQLSIWRFDGRSGDVLLRKNYVVVADDDNGPTDQGPFIRRHDKYQYRMLDAYGSGLGRMLTWTIKVTPDRIEDLGETPDIPEMDTVDEVFWRISQGKNAAELAAPTVVKQMAAIVAEARKTYKDPRFPSVGMLMGAAAIHHGEETIVEVGTDNDAAPRMRFTVLHRKTGFFLAKLEIPPEE